MTPGHRLAWAVLAGLVVALHIPATSNYFDNDDAWNYVLEAELALTGFESAFQQGANYLAFQNLHRLLPDLSWLPRYALFDLWMPGWKFPSVLLHAFNTVLLGLFARRLLARAGVERFDAAWTAAALFGLSPLHAQPVSWIGGTYDLMLGAAVLLALLALEAGRDRWMAVWAVVACLCKEQGVLVLPLLGLFSVVLQAGPDAAATRGLGSPGGGETDDPAAGRGLGAFRRRLERRWGPALRRLVPTACAVLAVLALRRVQMASATIQFDPQLTRSLAVGPIGVFYDAPFSAFAGLGTPLRSLLDVPIEVAAGLVAAGVLLGVPGPGWRARARVFGGLALAAVGFMLPVALLREFGSPLGLERIVFNDRYLYVSTLFVALALGGALLHRITPMRRILAVGCLGATLWTGVDAVATTVRADSSARVLLEALRPLRGPARGGTTEDLWLLTNMYREETFRLAMSRWLLHHTGVRVHWVQRGSWRVLSRVPDRTDGLDFMDSYVRVEKEPYEPPVQGEIRILRDASPDTGHEVTTPASPRKGPRDMVGPESLSLDHDAVPGALSFTTDVLPNGGVRFGIGEVAATPRGWTHRASIWLRAPIDAPRTLGFRITYTATARPLPIGLGRAFETGYLELHWTTRDTSPDLTYVVMPIAFDGQRHSEILWMDIDPVWATSGPVGAIGVHPLDRGGELTLHAIDALTLPRRRAVSTSAP